MTRTVHLRCNVRAYRKHGLRLGAVVMEWRFLCRETMRHISPDDMILIACKPGHPATLSAKLGDFKLIIP